jgi:hypothetical protein
MKGPKVLSFITGGKKKVGTNLRIELTRNKKRRSQVKILVDQAGEACIKTPRAIPINK